MQTAINVFKGVKPLPVVVAAILFFHPPQVFATQLHSSSEGILTHQIGHLFFLFSMVVLIITIIEKDLGQEKGWRMIMYAALFFILWNLDAFTAHFLDNQIHAVSIENISLTKIRIITNQDSSVLAWFYYALKLDHLLCLPAMLFLYRGISSLVSERRKTNSCKETV